MKIIYGEWNRVREIDHVKTGIAARKEREVSGVSLRSVARIMGISAMYLSDLERGRRPWTIKIADKFTACLGQMKEKEA